MLAWIHTGTHVCPCETRNLDQRKTTWLVINFDINTISYYVQNNNMFCEPKYLFKISNQKNFKEGKLELTVNMTLNKPFSCLLLACDTLYIFIQSFTYLSTWRLFSYQFKKIDWKITYPTLHFCIKCYENQRHSVITRLQHVGIPNRNDTK